MDSSDVRNPLVCNANIYGHINYDKPLICQGADFQTSYRIGLADIKPIQQEYEGIKRKLSKQLTERSIDVRDDNLLSTQRESYLTKRWDPSAQIYPNAPNNREIDYLRTIKETLYRRPPRPIPFPVSTMKSSYAMPSVPTSSFREVPAPDPYSYCEVRALGRDEQPPWRPEQPGYCKWLDPYLTTARGTHVPFTKEQQDGVARKDIITYYDLAHVPKVKGFGSKNPPCIDPMFPSRREPVYDTLQFKKRATIRVWPKPIPRVPHKGLQTEAQAKYIPPTKSDFYVHRNNSGVIYGGSLPEPSAYQTLAAPGMYDTESCHTGTGWPVRAIVDPGGSTEGVFRTGRKGSRFVHDSCCVQVIG